MPPKKPVSSEVLRLIESLVCAGKTDQQISVILQIKVRKIYKIRRDVLKINLYGSKRRCAHCGVNTSVTCFSQKSIYPDWCVICRRKFGGERGSGRERGCEGFNVRKSDQFIDAVCLRCGSDFKSEVFVGFGGRLDHYRCCPKCQVIVTKMERLSI
jgi:hypothetical protein